MNTYFIRENGAVECLGDDVLDLGPVRSVRRASRILPLHPVKRVAFRLLRVTFGDRGRVAAWSRKWRGPWLTLIPGRSPFIARSRRVCIDHEQKVLSKML